MTERLEDGSHPDTPATDNVLRAALLNAAERIELVARSTGGRVDSDDAAVITDTGQPSIFANPALLLRPLSPDSAPAFVERLSASAKSPVFLMSPFPTPDLEALGLTHFGHPPFMLRPPAPPAGPRPDPGGFTIEQARDTETLAEVERTLIDGFPVNDLAGAPAGCMLGADLLGGPFRLFVGKVDGRPVATASAMVRHGVVQVENVATLAEARGKGYGEAVTWAATLADPDLPAVLIASDLGKPVYERMGYLPIFRWSVWGFGLSGG